MSASVSENSKVLREGLRRYFAAFGDDVAEVIFHSMSRYGGLDSVLARLGIEDPGNSDDQYTAVYNFLRHQGKPLFMEKMGGLSKNYQIVPEAIPLEVLKSRQRGNEVLLKAEREARSKKDGTDRPKQEDTEGNPREGIRVYLPSRDDETQNLQRDDDPINPRKTASVAVPSPAPVPAPQEPAIAAKVSQMVETPAMTAKAPATIPGTRISVPLKPGAPPEPGTYDERTPAWDPSRSHDPKGAWPAAERRNGIERRQKPDERMEVELIFKNRRFGKDRRQGKERRRNWPRTGFVRPESVEQ